MQDTNGNRNDNQDFGTGYWTHYVEKVNQNVKPRTLGQCEKVVSHKATRRVLLPKLKLVFHKPGNKKTWKTQNTEL